MKIKMSQLAEKIENAKILQASQEPMICQQLPPLRNRCSIM
jgi:hypothetical protein